MIDLTDSSNQWFSHKCKQTMQCIHVCDDIKVLLAWFWNRHITLSSKAINYEGCFKEMQMKPASCATITDCLYVPPILQHNHIGKFKLVVNIFIEILFFIPFSVKQFLEYHESTCKHRGRESIILISHLKSSKIIFLIIL